MRRIYKKKTSAEKLSVASTQCEVCLFHSAQGGLPTVKRPADKDWPFLLNLGRNFFFFQQCQKSLDMIGRKENTEEEEKKNKNKKEEEGRVSERRNR